MSAGTAAQCLFSEWSPLWRWAQRALPLLLISMGWDTHWKEGHATLPFTPSPRGGRLTDQPSWEEGVRMASLVPRGVLSRSTEVITT